jgi:Na+/H+ antiporter NhaD/arsenite permease-like protein
MGSATTIATEYYVFGLTLAGIAVLHRYAVTIALIGLGALIVLTFAELGPAVGAHRLIDHVSHEWAVLTNLLLLLLGFSVLASQFERSNAPDVMPALLPGGWLGGFSLLVLVAVLSVFLDNIAGAMIGGVIARHLYQNRIRVGFVAAIVAASNAGGAGSVIGDTTTTMIWIQGISPIHVATAFVGAAAAILTFGIPAAVRQQRFQSITKPVLQTVNIDWTRLAVVALMLVSILLTNAIGNNYYPHLEASIPALGLALWIAIVLTSRLRPVDWAVVAAALPGAIFLVVLVASATLLPVKQLPSPSWEGALGLGFLSAIFDNIPLTALALRQGGYDWGLLAYAVGFGGSIIWFGSSAGVALTGLYPEARSALKWLGQAWEIPVGYVVGFFLMLALFGWNPSAG